MPVVYVWHVAVLMLGEGMLMFVRVRQGGGIVSMEVIVLVAVFVDHRNVDVKMGMLFACQQQRADCHQRRGKEE